ncbi:TonB-dependent receptor [Roseateles sp.]|uniref:TonB-dependent receptor n=1 Tax=Roseateles sp. TaxID=1971397 RepID=UPI002DF8ED09|nr:TonB-dependent receptor [Roseateles sp.]
MLRKTILSQSLLIAFSAASLSLAVAPAAYAQSTTVGSVFGQVAGQAGSQVVVENPATGLKRTVTTDANGKFTIAALPPGKYKASLVKDGKTLSTIDMDVLAGRGAEAIFEVAGTQQLEAVRVVGRAPTIDVSRSENSSTFTAAQLGTLPIATRDLNGIIALAANTTKADTRYAGGVSIGGGAPSENSYYINGFPVTNALTQLGSIELPFGAIAQADIKTGGFGAEFGRSVGGVVNITTKSGTNEWKGGVGVSFEPNAGRATPKSSYYANTGGNPTTDGTIYFDRSHNKRDLYTYGANVGGPIIKDSLFFFVAVDQTKTDLGYVNRTPQSAQLASSGWADETDKNDRYLAKFDWYINDKHQIEATFLGDNYKSTQDFSSYNYTTGQKGAYVFSEYSKNLANVTPAVGGEAQIVKYTGNLTDDLVVTALYGQSQSKHTDSYSFSPTDPSFGWTTTGRNPNLTYLDPSKGKNPLPFASTGIAPGAKEDTKSFRLDVDYRIGKHSLRAGLDENRLKSVNAGDVVIGGSSWQYASTTKPGFTGFGGTVPISSLTSPVPVTQPDGTVKNFYYYARRYILNTATNAQSNQSAQYIEDRHEVTDRLLLTYGLRNESFTNKNGDGETFLESKNFISPRFAAAWDVNGDSSMKIYGSAGRYSLQIPTHVAVRGASRSLYTNQYFAYTGIDPVTGLPTGLTQTGPAASANNEYGQAKDVRTVSAQGIKPTYQDEMTIGIEKALTPAFTGGAKLTYRKLKATIDDLCDPRPFEAYAANPANNINTDNWGGFGCASFNPGSSNTFLVDYAGTGQNLTRVTLSAADLGFDKAKRSYFALDFFLEHRMRDGWYGKVTYTYSKSKGNTEGQTKSDNAQTDVAATSTWDHPELMDGAYGYLPNDRTHQIKAYGYYQLTPEILVGANFLAESGRPRNCFGNYGGTRSAEFDDAIDYGNVYFYCDGKATPRGSLGRLPWNTKVDLNIAYKPSFAPGLTLRADVFNVFNKQVAAVVDETREVSYDPSTILPTYNRVISYTTPRTFRLTAEYNF